MIILTVLQSLEGPTLPELMKEVATPAPDQWRNVARLLGVPETLVRSIDDENRGKSADCYSAVFDYWEKSGTPPYTWKSIMEALGSSLVNRPDIVGNIRRK